MVEETVEEVVVETSEIIPEPPPSLDNLLQYLGTTLSPQPQHGPDMLPGDPNLSQTRAGLCYVQWCCFTWYPEALCDPTALLYPLFLFLVPVR